MALTPNDVVGANFSFVDNNRKVGLTSLYLPTGLDFDQYNDLVLGLGAAMQPLSNAGLQAGGFNAGYWDATIAAATLPNESEVERKLVLIFGTNRRFSDVRIEIPSPVFTIETDNTDEVDPSNPLVAAFANVVINGLVGLENGAVSAGGDGVTFLKRAYIRHRARRPTR